MRSPEHVAPNAAFGAIAVQFTDLSCAMAAARAGRDTGSSPSAARDAALTAAATSQTRATLSAPPESASGATPASRERDRRDRADVPFAHGQTTR